MKKLRILFALLAFAALTACSDDAPKKDGSIDEQYIHNLSRDGSIATYIKTDYEIYQMEPESTEWEKLNLSDYLGLGSSFQSTMSFQDGRMWQPVDFTARLTKEELLMDLVWRAYCKTVNEKRTLYIAPKFEYDEQNKKIFIDGRACEVLEFTKDKLVVSCESVFWYNYGDYQKYGSRKEVASFEISEPVRFDGTKVIRCESKIDCYRYIIEQAKEQFGDTINLNEVFESEIIFEQPNLNLNEMEAWVDEQERKLQ